MRESLTRLSARQWCCLWDAVQGSFIAPARRPKELWSETTEGAIAHQRSVIDFLCRRGLLRETAAGLYAATQMSALALLLPVSDNASLEGLAGTIASALMRAGGC